MSDKSITVADLAAGGACVPETTLFKEMWGEGGEMTYEKVMASALKFDWLFAAQHLLTTQQQRHFRAQVTADFRQIRPDRDADQSRRRRAMAKAFWLAWNSPEE